MNIFVENIVNSRLLNLHTAYLANVLSYDKKKFTAKIQPLGKVQAYGEEPQEQSPLSDVPVIQSARYTLKPRDLTGMLEHTDVNEMTVWEIKPLKSGDIVLCVCCERDITDAKKGRNTLPVEGHHSMSDSVVVGVL